MKQQLTHALVVSIFLMIFTFGIGIFGAIIAILIRDWGASIYFAFLALTWFWCGTLMSMVTYRIASIKPTQIDNNNVNCFTDWRVFFCSIFFSSDFQFQNYIAICLILTLFHTTLSLLIQYDSISGMENGLNEYYMSSKAAFVINLLFGGLLQLSLFYNLIFMVVQYKTTGNKIIYQIHIKETIVEDIKFKKSITYASKIFCVLSVLYYVLKIVLYSIVLNILDQDKNIKIFATIVMISSILCIILFAKILRQLTKILRNIAIINNSQTASCFIGWGTLMKALVFRKKNYLILAVILLLLVIQVIYGLISYPFYRIYSMPLLKVKSGILYIYFDTATITFLLIWQLKDIIASYCHKVQIVQVTSNLDQRNTIAQIAPQEPFLGGLVTHQRSEIMRLSNVFGQEEVASEDFGDCCICLDKMKEEQQIYRLKCHSCHVFHYSCISQWMISHNHCPLCQQAIY